MLPVEAVSAIVRLHEILLLEQNVAGTERTQTYGINPKISFVSKESQTWTQTWITH